MHDQERLETICDALRARYGDAGATAATQLRKWIGGEVRFANPEIIARHLDEKFLPLVFDAFRQEVPFGTGGQRGSVGYGPNRINPANVAITVQGHCNYLKAHQAHRGPLSVVVACDVREFNDISGRYAFLGQDHPLIGMSSRSFGKLACEIYAANGIVAHFPPPDSHQGTMSTPEMAFHIRRSGAIGGIQMSASHNPPDDNGLKIYNEFGSQPIAPDDELLAAQMQAVDDIHTMTFEDGVAKNLIRWITQEAHDAYIDVYADMYAGMPKPDGNLPIVYAPLNGCGLSSVGEVLDKVGFKVLVPPGEGPDGSFSAVPLRAPNPEVPQATRTAAAFADRVGASIVLSSDPDADRVGLDIKLPNGAWHHFDGNQIAAVLCRFLMLDPRGPRRKGLVITTFVTTRLLGEIAQKAGATLIENLPVGMKYVANVLNELERDGRYENIEMTPADLAFAAEESHGVIIAPDIREKDAAPACMYLALLHQILHREGRTLLDYYVETLSELGAHETVNRSIVMSGGEGARDKDAIMLALRTKPPKTLAGAKVERVVDFWDEKAFGPFKGETDKLSRNSIQFFTEGFVVAIRPSGTEPKLKFYCQLLPAKGAPPVRNAADLEGLKQTADKIARKCYNQIIGIIGRKLAPAALMLPDIIDLNQKIRFDEKLLPGLREKLVETSSLQGALDWLRGEAAAMIPGADPLPALKDAIALEARKWLKDAAGDAPKQLVRWATDADAKTQRGRSATTRKGQAFTVVSANCGAAARAIAIADGPIAERATATGAYIQQVSREDGAALPVIAGLQELGRFDARAGAPSYTDMLGLPATNGGFYYVPTLSTDWHPQKAKWKGRWEEGFCHAEQGVAACAMGGATLQDPERNAPSACAENPPFKGAVIDLPVVQFRHASTDELKKPWENWIRHRTTIGGVRHDVTFRHSRYLGDRDTEPRVATAHRVRLDGDEDSAFVFINLHLTTLRERAAEQPDAPRALRSVSPDAEYLRHLQLSEVCAFIWSIYEGEGLPVVVAGDFNTTPNRPDLKQFMKNAGLRAVFRSDKCWACGGAPLATAKTVYASKRRPNVLTTDADTFAKVAGDPGDAQPATEYCSQCERPLFTHKRNFQLVDNILYTAGAPKGVRLKARIGFDQPERNAGIGADTYFSDHFPIWSRFRLIPT